MSAFDGILTLLAIWTQNANFAKNGPRDFNNGSNECYWAVEYGSRVEMGLSRVSWMLTRVSHVLGWKYWTMPKRSHIDFINGSNERYWAAECDSRAKMILPRVSWELPREKSILRRTDFTSRRDGQKSASSGTQACWWNGKKLAG